MKRLKNIICSIRFRYIVLSVAILFCVSAVSVFDKNFWNTLVESIKTSLASTKPTEELFDDTGRVKFISVLFDKNSCLVSTQPLDYELCFADYNGVVNDDGCITIVGASGILYAPLSGEVTVTNLADNITEIQITHNSEMTSVFSGHIGIGVNDGDTIAKGQPIALLLGDLQFFITQAGEIVDTIDFSEGEILWKE